MALTLQKVKQLLKQGKIRAYKIMGGERPGAKVVKMKKGRGDAEKDKLLWAVSIWCKEHGVRMETEYRFHPVRKWRLDVAIPAFMIGLEYDGLMSEKSRHTTVTGFTGDTDKLNAAAAAGWTVIRFTALNYREAIQALDACISKR